MMKGLRVDSNLEDKRNPNYSFPMETNVATFYQTTVAARSMNIGHAAS